MKKILIVSIMILCLTIGACANNEQGTYYPNSSEMQKNLEKKGYDVTVTTDIQGGIDGTWLCAVKGDDYIEFYWLNEGQSTSIISDRLEDKYPNYENLVSMENDSKFGSLVFCSTASALKDSGIRNAKVKVDVDIDVDVY